MSDKPGYRRPQEGTQPEYLHPTYQSTNLRSPSKPLVFLPHSLSEITGPDHRRRATWATPITT